MGVADEIVVVSHGVVEKIGTPDDLYERPANDFVMSFLGPVTRPQGMARATARSRAAQCPDPGAARATVARIVRLGFEVRIDVATAGEEEVWVQVTRGEAEKLGPRVGDEVFVRLAHHAESKAAVVA